MNTGNEFETEPKNEYKEYTKARNFLVNSVMRELIGPGSEQVGPDPEEEIITENPRIRYTIGMLFPQELTAEEESIEEENLADDIADPDKIMDEYINLTNQYYPSAMGISFYTSGKCPSLNVKVSAAKYRKMTDDDECIVFLENIPESAKKDEKFIKSFRCEKGRIIISTALIKKEEDRAYFLNLSDDYLYRTAIFKLHSQAAYGWKRVIFPKECCLVNIPEEEIFKFEKEITNGLSLICIRRSEKNGNGKRTLFTISLMNKYKNTKKGSSERIFYQMGFKVLLNKESQSNFLEYNNSSKLSNDEEINSYKLLYRNKKEYATGHGCAVGWSSNDNGAVKELYTETMPSFEVPYNSFDVCEINSEIPEILSMYNLSDLSKMTDKSIFTGLYKFCNIYKKWIEKLEDKLCEVPSELHDIAHKHINQCRKTCERIKNGIHLLEQDDMALQAFRMANRAMLMQRIHSKLQKNQHFPGEGEIEKIDYEKYNDIHKWRPFQLAFLLLCLNSIHNKSCQEREIVDLIWFATAGGKTEAYLGITAFTIFLRRFKNKDKGGGTAVIMRYTLRLLTSQQFQRATTLICACELIRSENEQSLGKEKITIGLWVGSKLTPNNIKSAKEKINALQRGNSNENPFQLLSCPWCGTKLIKEKYVGKWGYRVNDRPKKFIFFCPEEKCDFSKELPVSIIDEDIYNHPPTLLFGTVDKFALIPWKAKASNIFALDINNNNLTPELIIQDELHLIEGALGTMVGLYESAIDTLCSVKGVNPKIITSTATIRRASNQCLALYNREVRQFPPSGLCAEDSFFARENCSDEIPGRLFAGIISSGRTHHTTLIRFMATLLQSVKAMKYKDKIKDPYWTLVGYYNTLRELGHNVTFINQDIPEYIETIAKRAVPKVYPRKLYEPVELTSRIPATRIPEILERLFIQYPDKDAIPVLFATNMIATGVDVDRLALMTVAGQPKLTAEYIQATSRIGRKYPGLVFTVYNGTKPRDRSHYEHFRVYHQSFYKYVEPATVTPFSGPARDRALHAVIVTLIRHLSGFNKNNQAAEAIKSIPEEKLIKIKNALVKRAKQIDSREETPTQKDIESIIQKYREKSECNEDIVYGNLGPYSNSKKGISLLTSSKEKPGIWPTLTSMRGVDKECHIDIVD